MITNSERKELKNAGREAKVASMQIDEVLRGIRKQMKKRDGMRETAELIDKNWKRFVNEIFPQYMPHVIYNNTHTIVYVDWVEGKPSNDKDMFRQFRYNGETIKLDVCRNYIYGTITKTIKKEIIDTETGDVHTVTVKENGKAVREEITCALVPRKKTAWGYTDVVYDAFCDAANELTSILAFEAALAASEAKQENELQEAA